MAKKLKKQIKRSMPLFVIASLLFTNVAVGLIFDLNISLQRVDNGVNVTIMTNQDVLAQSGDDFATTTVTVRNNPPNISVAPAENPVSASTTPTNMWASLTFTATADDQEGNDYYLLICSTNQATPGPGGAAPACTATQFCVSGLTNDEEAATCVYGNVQDPGAESQAWYAIVCDDHADEAECNLVDAQQQGAGESGSPFWVNHPPFFTVVDTTIDNQNPGGTFEITAYANDPDVASSADLMVLNVCSSNSWATTTGCADLTYCTGTSTSPDVSCSFATSSVAVDDTYVYYAFVRDYHFLAATTTHSSDYTVNNVAPQVSDVELYNSLPITLNFKGEAGVVATTSATVTDMNGCADIDSATGTIYWSGVTGLSECQPDNNDCYRIGSVNCVTDNVCTGASSLTYVCSATMEFHAIPTDATGGNPNAATWWLGAIRAFDEALSHVGTSTADVVDVFGVNSLNVAQTDIPFGSIRGGQNSGSANATTTVENYGNIPIDTQFEGVDMLRQGGGGYVGSDEQRYSTSTFTYPDVSITWQLASGTPSVARDLDLDRPTTTSFTVKDDVYWGIQIPAGKLSGIYEGFNYFQSATDPDGWN